MKIAVIGGGGVRSMFLAKSLAQSSLELGSRSQPVWVMKTLSGTAFFRSSSMSLV